MKSMNRICSEITGAVNGSTVFLEGHSLRKTMATTTLTSCVLTELMRILVKTCHWLAALKHNKRCHPHRMTHIKYKKLTRFPIGTSKAKRRVGQVAHQTTFILMIDPASTRFKLNGETEQTMSGRALARQSVDDDSFWTGGVTMIPLLVGALAICVLLTRSELRLWGKHRKTIKIKMLVKKKQINKQKKTERLMMLNLRLPGKADK